VCVPVINVVAYHHASLGDMCFHTSFLFGHILCPRGVYCTYFSVIWGSVVILHSIVHHLHMIASGVCVFVDGAPCM